MVRDFIPRLLIYPLIVVFVINIGAIYSRPPVHDPQFGALVKLLQWQDPVSGQQLNLPLDRTANLAQQITELQNLQEVDLAYTQVSELPPEIGNLTNLQTLYLAGTPVSELPPEIKVLPNLTILKTNFLMLVQLYANDFFGWYN